MSIDLIIKGDLDEYSSMGNYIVRRIQDDSHLDFDPHNEHIECVVIVVNGLGAGDELSVIEESNISISEKANLTRSPNMECNFGELLVIGIP